MFQGLLRRAEQSIDQVVAKYVGRAVVAIPLLIAGGFGTAAITTKLIEMYGTVVGCSIMAAGFAVLSLVLMAIVGSGPPQTAAETVSETAQAANGASETADDQLESDFDASALLTPEVRSFLASSAPMALPAIARGVGKNLPLILILALIGFVISRFAGASQDMATANMATAGADPGSPSI
ncbi:hypothetical protein [Hyphomicrobium sp.]|uniref:hypothetical protein n=1 Tax=Hyphomicrobium sp. TaxID=82 RepID=UPI003F714FCA